MVRFSSGASYFRRYTKFYPSKETASEEIAADSLFQYTSWEHQIEQWQKPVLDDKGGERERERKKER
jgi:non-lysosomal glucosylceramidase